MILKIQLLISSLLIVKDVYLYRKLWHAMNALWGVDRYRKEVIQVSTYKEWYKGLVSLWKVYLYDIQSYTLNGPGLFIWGNQPGQIRDQIKNLLCIEPG